MLSRLLIIGQVVDEMSHAYLGEHGPCSGGVWVGRPWTNLLALSPIALPTRPVLQESVACQYRNDIRVSKIMEREGKIRTFVVLMDIRNERYVLRKYHHEDEQSGKR